MENLFKIGDKVYYESRSRVGKIISRGVAKVEAFLGKNVIKLDNGQSTWLPRVDKYQEYNSDIILHATPLVLVIFGEK